MIDLNEELREFRESAAVNERWYEAARREGVSARIAREILWEMGIMLRFAQVIVEDAKRLGLDLVAESAREATRTHQEHMRQHCAETGLAVPKEALEVEA